LRIGFELKRDRSLTFQEGEFYVICQKEKLWWLAHVERELLRKGKVSRKNVKSQDVARLSPPQIVKEGNKDPFS
jgi:hypothetical protein